MLRLRDGVEAAGIGAEVDEGCGAVGVIPWDDENRVLGGAFDGPLGKHDSIISG